MNLLVRAPIWLRSLGLSATGLRRFIANRRGAAAIEFVVVVPFLLILYIGAMETSVALETSKKLSRGTSQIADIITQHDIITVAQVDDILKIGAASLHPYERTEPTFSVVAVRMEDDASDPGVQHPKIAWSRRLNTDGTIDVPFEEGSDAEDVPTAMRTENGFVIQLQSVLNYQPMTVDDLTSVRPLTFRKLIHLRPRYSSAIPCSDCPDRS